MKTVSHYSSIFILLAMDTQLNVTQKSDRTRIQVLAGGSIDHKLIQKTMCKMGPELMQLQGEGEEKELQEQYLARPGSFLNIQYNFLPQKH